MKAQGTHLGQCKGQTAIEYLLLLAVVVAMALIGFKTYLPVTQNSAALYFNRTVVGIMGPGGNCGDGVCASYEDNESCCTDCLPGCT